MTKYIALILALVFGAPVMAEEPTPLKVSVTVATRTPEPAFEQCIKDTLVDLITAAGTPVEFTSFEESIVDVFVVAQPINLKDETVAGFTAAVVVDVRNVPVQPYVGVATGSPNFICKGVGPAFASYMKTLVTYLRSQKAV